jgi:hypothetical protein
MGGGRWEIEGGGDTHTNILDCFDVLDVLRFSTVTFCNFTF